MGIRRRPLGYGLRIAAICLANGISELLSVDRDFTRFPALRVRNPLVGPVNAPNRGPNPVS